MAKSQARTRTVPTTITRVRQLKADFDRAHAAGMKALDDQDFRKLDRVIKKERALIAQLGGVARPPARKRR